jgi:hypothetical protein
MGFEAFLALLADFDQALEQMAALEGVPVIGRRFAAGDPAWTREFLDPVHLNRGGNRLLAEDVAAAIVGRMKQ